LLELLITMVLMGIAFAAVLGGMGIFLKAANNQRSVASLDAHIRTYAEALIAAPYVDCASSSTYSTVAAPTGLTVTLSIAYWDGNIPASFGAKCSTDVGVQQLTITLRAADGVTADLTVGKSR
jgi:type II secretory pathway pseudopilin PulG